MNVASAPFTAGSQHGFLTMVVQVEQLFVCVGIVNDGANGYAQRDVGSTRPVLVGTTPIFAVPGPMQAGIAIIDQRVDVAVGNSNNAAAPAAVAAVRPAFRNEFFAAKARRPIAAFAGNDFNGGFVNEFHKYRP